MQYIPFQGSASKHAFYLMRELCRPEWLKQPKRLPDAVFQHRAKSLYYGSKKQALYSYDKHMAFPPCFTINFGVGEADHIDGRGHPLASHLLAHPGVWRLETGEWQWSPETRNHDLHVLEGWFWPEYHHVLQPLYDYLKWWHDNSETGSPARTLLKQTYTAFIGLLAHPAKEASENYLYRPDWRNMIVSEARARLQGQIEKVRQLEGVEPIAVKVDALYYKQQIHCLPIGEKIGNFREEAL